MPAVVRPGAESVRQRSDRGALCDAGIASKLGGMIEANELTKRYGDKIAVDDLTFTCKPGVVTGFLGPNGAGKSTTMRMILGLDAPDLGPGDRQRQAVRELQAPLREVGALLEARAVHTGRSASNHLLALAATHGIRRSASTRSSSWSACRTSPASGPAGSRSAWASVSASRPRCSATPPP